MLRLLLLLGCVSTASAQDCGPESLSTIDVFPEIEPVLHVAVFGNLAVVATANAMKTIDITDPFEPRVLGEIRNLDRFGIPITDVGMIDGVVVYADGSNFLRLVDVRDPAQPRLAAEFNPSFEIIVGIDVQDPYVHSVGNSASPSGITRYDIYDISNPDVAVPVGTTSIGQFDCKSLAVDGDFAYAGGKFRNNNTNFITVVKFSITNPAQPIFVERNEFFTVNGTTGRFTNTIDIDAVGGAVFPLSTRDAFWVNAATLTQFDQETIAGQWLAIAADEKRIYLSGSQGIFRVYSREDPSSPNMFAEPCGGSSIFPCNPCDIHVLGPRDIDVLGDLVLLAGSPSTTNPPVDLAILGYDRDEDSIPDHLERTGVPYKDAMSTTRLVLDVNGDGMSDATVGRKDLFVEIDAVIPVAGSRLVTEADLSGVVAAFRDAPVDNGVGIALHLQFDDQDLTASAYPDGLNSSQFAADKAAKFLTSGERAVLMAGVASVKSVKQKLFRYCIIAQDGITNASGAGLNGQSELGGNDFILTATNRGNFRGVDFVAGTFMHELGHALGLGHGGCDNINYKPNYLSVMNYLWIGPKRPQDVHQQWSLRYSDFEFATVNEAALTESSPFVPLGQPIPAPLADFLTTFTVPSTMSPSGVAGKRVPFGAAVVDWDNDCGTPCLTPETGTYPGEVNDLCAASNVFCNDTGNSPGQQFVGHNDWTSLVYGFRGTAAFLDEATRVIPIEIPADELDAVFAGLVVLPDLPTPPCPGDANSDGAVNFGDIAEILVTFGNTSTPYGPGDADGNGMVNFTDVAVTLNNFGNICS